LKDEQLLFDLNIKEINKLIPEIKSCEGSSTQIIIMTNPIQDITDSLKLTTLTSPIKNSPSISQLFSDEILLTKGFVDFGPAVACVKYMETL
jgi:hypothetical protein